MSKSKNLGTIRWFNIDKGYGIVECDSGVRYFASLSDFKDKKQKIKSSALQNAEVKFSVDEETSVNNHFRAVDIEFK